MLPFFAVVLFVPPIVLIFVKPVTVFGIPLIAAYLFFVWALVIFLAFIFARRLGRPEPPDPTGDERG